MNLINNKREDSSLSSSHDGFVMIEPVDTDVVMVNDERDDDEVVVKQKEEDLLVVGNVVEITEQTLQTPMRNRRNNPGNRRSQMRLARGVSASNSQPKRPVTHFLCLLLSDNVKMTSTMQRVQDEIVENFSLPQYARVNVLNDLHVSISILSLKSREEESLVLSIVEQTRMDGLNKVSMGLTGISRFRSDVVWGKPSFRYIEEYRAMQEWRRVLNNALEEYVIDGVRPWVPHATIMKTNSKHKPRAVFTEEMERFGTRLVGDGIEPSDVYHVSLLSCKKDANHSYIRCGQIPLAKT
jgi:hypothetical protein